jgi:hypothetical protein
MNIIEAHALATILPDNELRALFPEDFRIMGGGSNLETLTLLPLFAAGMVSLSGMLDECKSIDDFKAACQHFRSLWDAEITGPDELKAEAAHVFGTLSDTIDEGIEPHQFTAAELN